MLINIASRNSIHDAPHQLFDMQLIVPSFNIEKDEDPTTFMTTICRWYVSVIGCHSRSQDAD